VQLRLPWPQPQGDGDPASPPAAPVRRLAPQTPLAITIGDESLPVEVVRHRRARRYIVRIGPMGQVRLTVPQRASIAGGLRFAERQAAWIARERLRHHVRAAPWRDGTRILFRGAQLALRVDGGTVLLGDAHVMLGRRDEGVRAAVEAHLRAVATVELTARCRQLAGECGERVARVSVRNQRSRWGACSSARVITLNWRLIQMPPRVADYVIFHELMHLRQANHSRRFWREVDRVCPWWREAERWLRQHGRTVM
jgi:predicted metal-dependent hydrolase